jgi:hypothetical protein
MTMAYQRKSNGDDDQHHLPGVAAIKCTPSSLPLAVDYVEDGERLAFASTGFTNLTTTGSAISTACILNHPLPNHKAYTLKIQGTT